MARAAPSLRCHLTPAKIITEGGKYQFNNRLDGMGCKGWLSLKRKKKKVLFPFEFLKPVSRWWVLLCLCSI